MISVIVPVYNVENYIERCILSIINQTYSNFELLLINDGSTDSSYEICQKWEATDPRIKVFSKQNGGVSSARNLGLDHCMGDYIFFVDGDDWLAPHCLEVLIQKMTPDIDLVIGEHQDVNDEVTCSSLNRTSHKNHEGILSHEEMISDIYQAEFYTRVIWAKLYRREVWNNLRFNHMIYSEDTYALFQIFDKIEKSYCTQETVYFYLLRLSSASRKLKILEYENYLETLLFMYSNTLKKYTIHRESLAKRYNNTAYILLKIYAKLHQRKKAFKLIRNMKFVYKTSQIQNPSLSQKILLLPSSVIYFLICIKNILRP